MMCLVKGALERETRLNISVARHLRARVTVIPFFGTRKARADAGMSRTAARNAKKLGASLGQGPVPRRGHGQGSQVLTGTSSPRLSSSFGPGASPPRHDLAV